VTCIHSDPVAVLFAAFVTAFSSAARADPIQASLAVTRDDGSRGCPDSATLAERVETVAGKRLFDSALDAERDTWVTVEFVRDFGGYRAVISARGSRQGTRALDDVGPECTSLADAVAITLAILLDPPLTKGEASSPALAAAVPVAVTPAAVTSATVAVPPTDSLPSGTSTPAKGREPVTFGLEGSAGASFAVLDGVAPLVEAGGRARLSDVLALALGGGFVPPDRVESGSGSVDVSLVFGYFRACANLLPRRRIVLEACLEPMLGGLSGSGNEYETTDTEWVFWSAAAGVLQGYGTISESVLWSIRARLLTPFVKHGFSVSRGGDQEEVFKLSGIGGTLAIGLVAEL
jgi:hypothetical protein